MSSLNVRLGEALSKAIKRQAAVINCYTQLPTMKNDETDESAAGTAAYTHKILDDPRLVSVALTNDNAINGIDGFTISIVKKAEYIR